MKEILKSIFFFGVVLILSCEQKEGFTPITFDPYGGIENLQGNNTSGFFRTELINGRWWFVDPLNHAFLSLGSDSVAFYDDFAPALGYSPYYLNVVAKYGGGELEHKRKWAQDVRDRFALLGFNTLGSWSDDGITVFQSTLSYTVNLNFTPEAVKNFGSNNVPTVSEGWWIGFPDVFDKRFEENCKEIVKKKIRPEMIGDSFLIGYFTDNELNWFGDATFWYNPGHTLADDFISTDSTYAGKQYWVNEFLMKKKGYTVESLNSAYGTNFTSWDEVLSLKQLPNSSSHPAIEADKKEFLYEIGEQYFRVTSEAIKSADPNHLNLCARFASDAPDEIIVKAGKYCDVVSVNDYYVLNDEVSDAVLGDPVERWKRLYELTKTETEGKPFLLTEFGIRARDSGLPNSWGAGWWVDYQEERGQFYRDVLDRLLWLNYEENFLIGAHWFEWADEPATGRFDGENSNYGINNIKDEPYLTFYQMVGNYNREVYYRLLGLKYNKLPQVELIYPEDGSIFEAGVDRFTWKGPADAEDYKLLISPFRNFADGVTIKIPVQKNPEEAGIILPQGRWFWSVAPEGTQYIAGDFSIPWSFTISQDSTICGDYNNPQNWKNYVETPSPDNSDGSALILPDLNNPWTMRAIFTINSLGKNNRVNNGNGGRVVLKSIDCRESIPSSNKLSFNIMPSRIVDASADFSVSTKFLRIYVKDASNAEILNQQIDPAGSFTLDSWNKVNIVLNNSQVKEIGFYMEINDAGIPLDHRIVSWLSDIKVE